MQVDESLINEIDELVNKHSGPELWEETVRLAVKRNPQIARDVLLTIKDNKEIRASMFDQKYGESTDKTMRQTMRIPQSVDDLLCIVDPENFPMSKLKHPEGLKVMMKLHKVLPEFFVVDRI